MSNRWIVLAALLAALGVAMGAFGAHVLKLWLPLQKMTIFETAVRYHLFHTLALLACGVLITTHPAHAAGLRWVAGLLTAGIVLFSGGLYAAALSDLDPFMWATPVGGLAWIAAWLLLAYLFWRKPGRGA
ncbi:MAG: DUF423 domain-containing protein [SAR324 cluster bacterium]|nr:DUF423 domain-containing protein [SAR324 cluster bacterium]